MLKVRGISLLLMFLPLFASASYGENLYGEEGIPRILGGGHCGCARMDGCARKCRRSLCDPSMEFFLRGCAD